VRIDIHESDKIDEKALKALIRAVVLNTSSTAQSWPTEFRIVGRDETRQSAACCCETTGTPPTCPVMKIAIASDHAGFAYKEQIKGLLQSLGHQVRDFGTNSDRLADYPVFIRPAADAVARGECERGVVLGGSGNGEAIVANKVRGIRCALCWSLDTARWSREHNDANVLAIGQRTIPTQLALEIVRVWLTTAFAGGRHAARVNAIEG
jgi:ribose 5-phosphate isomerase B